MNRFWKWWPSAAGVLLFVWGLPSFVGYDRETWLYSWIPTALEWLNVWPALWGAIVALLLVWPFVTVKESVTKRAKRAGLNVRDTSRRVESALLGAPFRYWFVDGTTTRPPKKARLRNGQWLNIEWWPGHPQQGDTLHLKTRGDRNALSIVVSNPPVNRTWVTGPMDGRWVKHEGSSYVLELARFQGPPYMVRVTMERLEK